MSLSTEEIKAIAQEMAKLSGGQPDLSGLLDELNAQDFFPRVATDYPLVKALKEAFDKGTVFVKVGDANVPCITVQQYDQIVADLKSKGQFWPKPSFYAGPEGNRAFMNFRNDNPRGSRWSIGSRVMRPTGQVRS